MTKAAAIVDAYNNVPHVGHCHPRVVEAGAAADARAQHEHAIPERPARTTYAERLLATLPAPLDVVLLRELGERGERARAAPGARVHRRPRHDRARRGVPRQHDVAHRHQSVQARGPRRQRRAGLGAHVAPLPDDYRGPFKRERSAAPARNTRRRSARSSSASRARAPAVAAFIAETARASAAS